MYLLPLETRGACGPANLSCATPQVLRRFFFFMGRLFFLVEVFCQSAIFFPFDFPFSCSVSFPLMVFILLRGELPYGFFFSPMFR